ncbi:hypothetical protein ACS0TY_010139 [Phlomoides rotata]
MTSGDMEIVEIDDELDALSSLRMELTQLSTQASHSIYKVPKLLRDVNSKAYEPQIITIGPYHHGKDEYKPMEEVKLRYMQSLLARKPDVGLERYLSIIAGLEKKVRDCYAETIRFNVADFIKMLVLDGCFIIGLIGESTIHNDRTFPGLKWDLVLLENQIPFFVLCELFDLIQGPDQHTLLMRRVLDYFEYVFPGNVLYKPEKRSEEVKHILDLIHSNWCPSPHNISTATQASSITSFLIPTAAQLKDANVKFERKEYDRDSETFRESRGTTVFDVEFNQDNGVMSMPALVITDGTESLLRNLIAYEQFFPTHEPAPVTDYALLLDCLVNSSKDVQILSQHGIIQNFVSSDQAVADIVNRLTLKISHYVDNMMYVDIFNRINTHHKNRWNRAMAVYHRDYFSSPWAYVSFVAALVLLLLTAAQVVFAALQQFK